MWEVADIRDNFAKHSVAICGLGGLGSNVAVMLVRAGVKKLHLIDFDQVEESNLNRQQYVQRHVGKNKTDALIEILLEIASDLELRVDTEKITGNNLCDLVEHEDIICEAFDDAESKAMLVNMVAEHFSEKYIVSGSGMAGIDSVNKIKTRKITSHLYLCGDEISAVDEIPELVASRVMTCAAHQAHMILRIMMGEQEC